MSESSDFSLYLKEMRPEFNIISAYNPHSSLIPVAQIEGFTFTLLGASSNGSIFAGQGRLLALNGEFDQAIDRLNLAIDINPNYALAYYGLGYTLTVSGHPDKALTMFDKALLLSPMDHYRWAFYSARSTTTGSALDAWRAGR